MRKATKESIKSIAGIVLGAIIMAVAMRLFLIDNKIAPGGVSGLATIMHHLLHLSPGTIILSVNIPMFLLAFKSEGWQYILKTLLAVTVMSLCTDHIPIPCITKNLVLSSLFGGIVLGIGLGVIVSSGGNSGGTVLLAKLIQRLVPHVSIAWVLFAIDFIVVVLSGIVFNIELALYAMIALYLSSKAMDIVIQGPAIGRTLYIITDREESIAQALMQKLNRGCTGVPARGMYTKEERQMLICVVHSSREVMLAKQIVQDIDNKAFMFIGNMAEVLGEGFIAADH